MFECTFVYIVVLGAFTNQHHRTYNNYYSTRWVYPVLFAHREMGSYQKTPGGSIAREAYFGGGVSGID